MGQNEKDYKKLMDMKNEYEDIEMSAEQIEAMKQSISKAKKENDMKNYGKNKAMMRTMVAAAAAVAVFVTLPNTSSDVAYAMSNIPVLGKLVDVVTFREYEYESERQNADVKVPELVAIDGMEMDQNGQIGATENEEENAGQTGSGPVRENLQKTTDEINAEIQEITDQIVAEFEESMENEEGYQEIVVNHEILATTEDYFTLKLICYQGAGSGAEWNYFYTIDLKTGERLTLADLFTEGADYITLISENIKEQMRQQMAADENVSYWLDDEEVPEWNFKNITDETSFYVNGDGNIVIAFNEGDVAPMYMGCVEFVIPDEIIMEIRK